jgi:HEAT repeat protein
VKSDPVSPLVQLDEIRSNLSQPDAEIRLRAVRDLVSLQDPSLIPDLELQAERETDIQVLYEVRSGLGMLKKLGQEKAPKSKPVNQNLERVSRALESENPKLVNKAFRYIVQYRLKDFLPEMQKKAEQSGSSYHKGLIIRLMLSLGGELYFREIATYLRDDDPRIISTAIEALEIIGNTQALGYITQFVSHEHNRVQATAMKALYNLGNQGALRLFLKLIASPHAAYRNSAAYALKEMHIPASIPLLERLYQDEDTSVREKAREGLAFLADKGSEKAKNILENQPEPSPKSESSGERTAADWIESIRYALEIQDKQSLEIFLLRLKEHGSDQGEEDEKVIASLIMGIGRLGTKAESEIILPFLSHRNNRVRANAVEALGLLLEKTKRGCLLACFEDQNNRVIGNAVLALIHDFKQEASLALAEIAQSSNMLDQLTAVYCIGALGDERHLQLSDYLLESSFTEVREKIVRVLETLGAESAKALRILEQWKLRMLNFDEQMIPEEPPKPSLSETKTFPLLPKTLSPSISESVEPSKAKPVRNWHQASFTIFLFIFALEIVLNLLALSLGDRIRFLQSTISVLRSLFMVDSAFHLFTHLTLPLCSAYFLSKNRTKIWSYPLMTGLCLGLVLHQHIVFLDAAGVRFGSSLNFLSHYSSLHYGTHYAGNPFLAMQCLNIPLLLLPLGIEAWIRYGYARLAIGIVFLSLSLSSLWIASLDRSIAHEFHKEKSIKFRAELRTRQRELKALLTQNRLDRLANLALRGKALSKNSQNSLDGRLVRLRFEARRLRTQLKNIEKRLHKLNQEIK